MKTQYYTATSIDGFIADADNSLDWLFQVEAMPTRHGSGRVLRSFMADVGAMAMGSTTYEWIAAHTGFLDDPSKWEYTFRPGCSAAATCRDPTARTSASSRGDVAPVHAEMVEAAAGKNVWLVGGGDLVGQFHDQRICWTR